MSTPRRKLFICLAVLRYQIPDQLSWQIPMNLRSWNLCYQKKTLFGGESFWATATVRYFWWFGWTVINSWYSIHFVAMILRYGLYKSRGSGRTQHISYSDAWPKKGSACNLRLSNFQTSLTNFQNLKQKIINNENDCLLSSFVILGSKMVASGRTPPSTLDDSKSIASKGTGQGDMGQSTGLVPKSEAKPTRTAYRKRRTNFEIWTAGVTNLKTS